MRGLYKQLLVASTHGTTATVDVTREDTPSSLLHRIQKRIENIEADTVEISVYTSAGKKVCPTSHQLLDTLQHGSMLHCVLPIVGGKGGFGSNLKASGKHKMTDNIDACRDLQGRRVRHKTAEAKLKTWQSQAQERELEKVAMEYIKKPNHTEVEVDVQEVKEMTRKARKDVKGAVSAGLAREHQQAPLGTSDSKAHKKLAMYDDDSSDDESD